MVDIKRAQTFFLILTGKPPSSHDIEKLAHVVHDLKLLKEHILLNHELAPALSKIFNDHKMRFFDSAIGELTISNVRIQSRSEKLISELDIKLEAFNKIEARLNSIESRLFVLTDIFEALRK